MANIVLATLTAYNIDKDRVIIVTSDNAPNNDTLI
jgi:hypothetical protein